MIVASRILELHSDSGRQIEVLVRIFAPERADVDWICRFEIGWPEGKAERWGAGVDTVQAMLSACQMIGAEIYTSVYHQEGRLTWLREGAGYGFPVPNNIRDLLIGDDARYL